jgi:formate dehydrogenase accessory protein FdhD
VVTEGIVAPKEVQKVCYAVLFNLDGELIKASEDIGRHNSVDKVVGYVLLHNVRLAEAILACSGRQPEGMILKAARATIPIVITKAAVTNKGVDAAQQLGVTLIGCARGSFYALYSPATGRGYRVTGRARGLLLLGVRTWMLISLD